MVHSPATYGQEIGCCAAVSPPLCARLMELACAVSGAGVGAGAGWAPAAVANRPPVMTARLTPAAANSRRSLFIDVFSSRDKTDESSPGRVPQRSPHRF